MENFIIWLFDSFYAFFEVLTVSTVDFIDNLSVDLGAMQAGLVTYDINLVLFSDTPILSTNLYDLAVTFFAIFYTVVFITIVWKIIKKVFVKITGWKRW